MNTVISQNLKTLRIKNNLTQRQLCEKLKNYGCNISRTTYTKYELGKNSLSYDVLVAITKIYNVSSDYILGIK